MDYVEPKTQMDVLNFFRESLFGEENLWDGARVLLADVPLDKAEAKKVLPEGLRFDGEPTASLFIAHYPKTSFTVPYRESAVLIHVRSAFGKGVHCPWMIVDDDTAMIYGRELLGFPKKMGEFVFEERGGRVKTSITRRGVTVLELDGKLGPAEDSPKPVLGRKIFNTGGPAQLLLLKPLWLFHPTEVIHESYHADVKVTVREAENDPISRLFSGGTAKGRFVVLDIPSAKYMAPVGMGGLIHFGKTFPMRYK